MEIRCPTCQHPIELRCREASGEASSLLQTIVGVVHCPNCGLIRLPVDADRTATFETSAEKLVGSEVAHFSLTRLLGRGGYGEVWLANDVLLGRQVALKLPLAKDAQTAHLMHEAQTAAHLRHPNIVSVYEVGSEKTQLFIASEYIEGLTLRDLLSAGAPGIARTVELVTAVAGALHHAHQQGIVHRDVKPGNIIINAEGQPIVTDFGLAKWISQRETISSEGQVLGTARYMSPEQAGGKTQETDQRSDIYSLGVILFEMLTGHAPFRGNIRALLHQKVFDDAPSPRRLVPGLPKDLETICLKCLEREPARRYQTARELADELQRFTGGEPIKARPISAPQRLWRWCRRRPAVAGLLAGLVLSLSAGLIGVSFFYWRAAESAEWTRRSLYRSQMNLTAQYMAKGDIAGVKQTLQRIASDGQLAGLRGFEWHYFDAVAAPVVQLLNQGDVVRDVAISRAGNWIVSIGNDRSARIWDAASGETIGALTLGAGRFQACDFSPTGDDVATGGSDGMVRIWDPRNPSAPLREMKHGPPVAVVRFSPDGKTLLSCGLSGAVRLWDWAAASLLAEIPAGKSGAKDVRFFPDGKRIAVATGDGRVRLWEIDGQTIAGELAPNATIESIAISDDGATLVTGSFGGTLRVWSVADAAVRFEHATDAGRIGDLEFLKIHSQSQAESFPKTERRQAADQPGVDSSDSQLLAFLASDGRLHVFDLEKQQDIRVLNTHNLSDGVLARSANGEFLVTGSGDGSIKLLKIRSLLQPAVFWHDAHVRAVGFLPDGKRLVAASGDGAIRAWDIESGRSNLLAEATGREVTCISVCRRGNQIAAAGVAPQVGIWDGESGELLREVSVPQSGITDLAYSFSGRRLAVATRLGGAYLYQADDWTKAPAVLASRPSAAQGLAFSTDDRILAIAYEDGEVHFADPATNSPLGKPVRLATLPLALQFCQSGNVLAIGTDSGEIYLYDFSLRRMRSIIKGHTARINALAALPDGMTLISGGRDKELRLWDVSSGELLATLFGHRRQIFSIAVSPDGTTIASGSLEGDIRIWRTRPTE